ncbi:MAG: signal peptidase II [Deltaproteobacteria bacterium]|nr:signal peptidase II [Deltaproteobacteria bacterium]
MTANPKLTPLAARAHKLSLLFLLLMVLGSIGLDQVTKYHAQSTLMVWSDAENLSSYRGQRYPLWSSDGSDGAPDGSHAFISLSTNYVRNLGAAWGALSNLPDVIRVPFFYLVTCLAVFIILLYLRSTPVHHRLAIFSLSLILSGAIGNFLDRIRFGYVIDWIDVRWNLAGWRYDFPNFNFADSCITVGVSLLLVDMLFLERKREQTAVATP